MSWISFVYVDRLKTHILPSSLVEIHDEYVADGFKSHPVKPPTILEECYLDVGGPAYTDRPIEEFFVDGLNVCVPSEELPLFYETWATLTKRYTRTTGSPYFKLHGMHIALVLTPMPHARFVTDVHERLTHAKLRADEFAAKRQSINEVIADANVAARKGPVR